MLHCNVNIQSTSESRPNYMRKAVSIATIVAIPAVSMANAAMGMGLERWDFAAWIAYCLAMCIGEAWLIGRWLNLNWIQSLSRSVLANAITGYCGLGCLAPFLHQSLIGPAINPNPVLESLAILSIFALPSAFFEHFFWNFRRKTQEDSVQLIQSQPKVLARTVIAHFLLIPIGFLILIVPERPYKGLEAFTNYARNRQIIDLNQAISKYVSIHQRMPQSRSLSDLGRDVGYSIDPICFERAIFSRFGADTTENFGIEINPTLVGQSVEQIDSRDIESTWYIRAVSSKKRAVTIEYQSGGNLWINRNQN